MDLAREIYNPRSYRKVLTYLLLCIVNVFDALNSFLKRE